MRREVSQQHRRTGNLAALQPESAPMLALAQTCVSAQLVALTTLTTGCENITDSPNCRLLRLGKPTDE